MASEGGGLGGRRQGVGTGPPAARTATGATVVDVAPCGWEATSSLLICPFISRTFFPFWSETTVFKHQRLILKKSSPVCL